MNIRRFRTSLAAALLAGFMMLSPSAQASVDFTDIWETEGGIEPGWGVNFAHTGDFIFATFFVYGPNGTPVWYTAQLSRTGGDSFSGLVYAVTGTWFGAPIFVPVPPSNVIAVGDATFTATNSHRGSFRYRIDTVSVNKNLARFTTVPLVVTGVYLGAVAGTTSGTCPNFQTGIFLSPMQFNVTRSAPDIVRIEFLGADSSNLGSVVCVMEGPATQHGKVLQLPSAAYQCANGVSATTVIDSLRLLDDGIEGHWRATLQASCIQQGRLAGVRQ